MENQKPTENQNNIKDVTNETKVPEKTEIVQSGENISKYESEEEYNSVLNSTKAEIEKLNEESKTTLNFNELRQSLNDVKDKIKGLFLKDDDNKALNSEIDESLNLLSERQADEFEKLNKESEENYNKIKPLIDETIKKVEENNNFKEARESLIKVQDQFKGIRLKKSHRDELLDMVKNTFEKLTQKQIEERENYEMETIENYHRLKQIIDEACKYADTTDKFGKARERLIKAQDEIKGQKLKRDQRDELYEMIRESFNRLNKRQEEDREIFEKEAKINYENLRKIVNEACKFAEDTSDFKEARDALINAQSTIKGMKLKRDQRDELYSDIRKVFNLVNERQEKDREQFEIESKENYEKLIQKVEDAFKLVEESNDLNSIRDNLITIQSEVKILKLKRSQRNELFAKIREAFSKFDKKKEEYFANRDNARRQKAGSVKDNLEGKVQRIQEAIERDQESLDFQNNKLKKIEAGEDISDTKEEVKNVIKMISDRLSEKEKSLEDAKSKLVELKTKKENKGIDEKTSDNKKEIVAETEKVEQIKSNEMIVSLEAQKEQEAENEIQNSNQNEEENEDKDS